MQTIPNSLRIGVLRGGAEGGYDHSLLNGAHILQCLSDSHKPVDIFISKDGKWHMHGVEKSPERILKNVDVIWNTLHNVYPENNKIREILHSTPYTGSSRFSFSLAENKRMAKERAVSLGIKTPIFVVVKESDPVYEKAKEIFNSLPHPLVVKPVIGGSNLGFYIVKSFSELLAALEIVLEGSPGALIEEYISGKEASCIIVDNFRNRDIYAFPPRGVYDNMVLTRQETQAIEDIARNIHREFAISQYSQSDFIVSPRRGVYFLEVSTLPNTKDGSLLSKSLETVGVSKKEFLHHMIMLALNER